MLGDLGFNPWYVGGGVKSGVANISKGTMDSFNPWYVGGGVKSRKDITEGLPGISFNPWYVGGGVKSHHRSKKLLNEGRVSILGMLEGVLKAARYTVSSAP